MTDLACWRQNGEQVVVRIRGNEFLMDNVEAYELAARIDSVVHYRQNESLSEGYKALRSRPKAKPTATILANIKAAMGLAPKTGSFRR